MSMDFKGMFAPIGSLLAGLTMTCPAVVMAQDLITVDDLYIMYQPEPAHYQPSGDDLDLADQGKSFDITCVIAPSGGLDDCQAEDNDMVDQNFVRVAVKNVGKWVVGPQTRSGDSTAGKVVIVTCRFRLEGAEERTTVAAR